MAEEGYKVSLHVYDLSQGLARQLSTSFLGKAIDGIWHTGIVVYGNEYYFGGGIQHSPVGATPYGKPLRVVDLGITHIPQEVFQEYLAEISPRYTAETYSLLRHNCNNFSNEVAQFLMGVSIPSYIIDLPNEVMSSPMGALILPMIQQLEATLRAGAVPQAPQFKPASATSASREHTQPRATASTPSISSARETLANSLLNGREEPVKQLKDDGVKAPEKPKASVTDAPPAVKPAGTQNQTENTDPLGEARNRVQEEICKEFAAIMASGTLRASEAAALAARRVMERHRAATSQS